MRRRLCHAAITSNGCRTGPPTRSPPALDFDEDGEVPALALPFPALLAALLPPPPPLFVAFAEAPPPLLLLLLLVVAQHSTSMGAEA